MAYTSAEVPGVSYVETIDYLMSDGPVVIFAGVDFDTSNVGQVTKVTTATSGMCAGIAQESCTAAQVTAGKGRIECQVHGVAKFVAGADCSGAYGTFLCFDDAVGRMKPCAAVSQTLYMTHGVCLNDPDTDGDIGFMLLNLNVPYYVAVT